LLKSDKLEHYEKHLIEKIILGTASETDYKSSLEDLSKYLRQHFEKDVIILVDEYDAPIINGFKNTPKPIKSKRGETTYYENVINFMQTFLGSAFKGNNNIEKGLITGVMRVGRESIFSEWNNFSVYGITSNYFTDKFGFTKQETEKPGIVWLKKVEPCAAYSCSWVKHLCVPVQLYVHTSIVKNYL